jgi:hypothetical protein
LLGIALAIAATPGFAATNADGSVGATIASAIAIEKTVDLHFGVIVPSATADTVVVTPAGERSHPGSGVTMSGTGAARGSVSGTLVSAIEIDKETDLNFGAVIAGTPGSVQLAASAGGARTPNEVTLVAGSATHAACFRVRGTGSATFAVTLSQPSGGILKAIGWASGQTTEEMGITLEGDGAVHALSNGEKLIYVGGTINISATNVPGPYSGIFDVAVAYN